MSEKPMTATEALRLREDLKNTNEFKAACEALDKANREMIDPILDELIKIAHERKFKDHLSWAKMVLKGWRGRL